MRMIVLYLTAAAVLVCVALLTTGISVFELDHGSMVILLTLAAVALAALAVFVYKNRKALDDAVEGNHESLSKLLYSKKKRRRQ